ncbi:MAG TPA: coproporphyrinogen III oxidase, partial [Gemmatimonadales bacterium]|nr:coproporphyrinogen III oxidase [Gemmatimonadales bacterium]
MKETRREQAAVWARRLHDEITGFFTELDAGGAFREDVWERPGGGGGVARVLAEGNTFEKAGINRSAVDGRLPAGLAQRLGS